jgi:rare lipoprotein A
MPTIVQVTNLDNGRSIQLRVNDRGPMVGDRILQVSHRAAELLGFGDGGTAKVRVQVVKLETMQAQSLAKHSAGEDVAGEAPPLAVPHAAVAAETLAPLGSNAPPQPIPPAPQPPPRVVEAPAPQQAAKPVVNLFPVRPNHSIFIQAGAFSNNANAMRMKEKLDSLGTVVVASIRVNGADLYRVRLGPIPSVDEADRLLSRAQSAGASDAKIVVD